MLKKVLPILLALSFLLSACGAEPAAPTMSPADVEGTAVSAALTMVGLTQAAIPTATPLPPTETPSPTPLPTFTQQPLSIPTLEQLILPTATTSSAGADECNKPLNVGEAGPTNPMRIENATTGTIQYMSAFLNKNPFGQCGYLSYNNIKPGGKKVLNLPKGDWWFWAGIVYKDREGNSTGACTIRLGDEDMLRILVKDETIRCLP